MNDNFIYKSLPKVRKEFEQSLYRKISIDTLNLQKKYSNPKKIRWHQVAFIVVGLLTLLAWSQIQFIVRYVPIGDLWLVEFNKVTSSEPAPTVFIPTPLATQRAWDGKTMPEIRIMNIYFPSWIPSDFLPIVPPQEMLSSHQTIGGWRNDSEEEIRLFITPFAGGMRPYAPAGMYKEVAINGQPAILIYGRLALRDKDNPQAQREWDEYLGLQLHWLLKNNYVYTLETFGAYVSEADLIQMAESMKEASWFSTPVP
jgi:hypothetical protein